MKAADLKEKVRVEIIKGMGLNISFAGADRIADAIMTTGGVEDLVEENERLSNDLGVMASKMHNERAKVAELTAALERIVKHASCPASPAGFHNIAGIAVDAIAGKYTI